MEVLTPELIELMITQLPNFTGFIIMSVLLVWQTKKAWSMAELILERCIPDGDCIEKDASIVSNTQHIDGL